VEIFRMKQNSINEAILFGVVDFGVCLH
jgi:hypothetical protein